MHLNCNLGIGMVGKLLIQKRRYRRFCIKSLPTMGIGDDTFILCGKKKKIII